MTLLIALAAPAQGLACTPTTSVADAEAAGYYVAADCLGIGGCGHLLVWIYQESNGIAGLQRADEVHDDTCGGEIPGDHIVF